MDGPSIMKRLVQGIEDETRMGGPARPSLPVHAVERAWSGLVVNRRADRLATDDALKTHCPHLRAIGRYYLG